MTAAETTERATQRYAGADWLRAQQRYLPKPQELSPLGERVADLLGELFYGLYHWRGWQTVDWTNPHHIRVTLGWSRACLSTFDNSDLTRLVFLAHRFAIRVELSPCNFSHIELLFHQRSHDATDTSHRHPTLAEAVARFEGVTA